MQFSSKDSKTKIVSRVDKCLIFVLEQFFLIKQPKTGQKVQHREKETIEKKYGKQILG